MVVTRHRTGGSGFGSGSGMSTEPIDERLCEFVTSEVTRSILDVTPVMFGSIKDVIIELIEDQLRIYRSDLSAS